MIFEFDNYRSFLKSTLAERIGKNSSYSLRAMAKNLSIAPSTLSEVLKGTANLSAEKAAQVAKKLELTFEEQEYFILLIQKETATSNENKEQILYRLTKLNPKPESVRDLSVDAFKAISEWYHFVIIEMLTLKDFEFTAKNVASRLNLTVFEVEAAIERLVRLDMIEMNDSGNYIYMPDQIKFASDGPNLALRKFHQHMLTKAIESMETQSNQEKFIGSETFAFDPEDLNKANQEIEKMCSALIKIAKNGKKRTEVYHLGVQLFNLTKKKKV